ncbi:hypothetical protein CVV67_02470 [Arthrobacter stackebrandtii]|nr:hypothetical protein CVV67_02470 [Arthrobacter stackebrandtii]
MTQARSSFTVGWHSGYMDITWLLVALILVVAFAAISIVGALHRIRDANEKTLALLEEQLARKAEGSDSR